MIKYKEYYFTTKKWSDGKYTWHIRNKQGEELQTGEDSFETKLEAEMDCIDHINDYYD